MTEVRKGSSFGLPIVFCLLSAGVVSGLGGAAVSPGQEESGSKREARPPDGFQQILPRGRIASIDEPEFVTADEAEIPDEAWVLGIEVGGQARAYSLNLLNRHEVVNDRVRGQTFAAVW